MACETEELARLLKILAVETRVKIIEMLKGQMLCMGALARQLDVTQGAVSQHLRVMRDAGLLLAEKRGQYVHYRLNERTLRKWQGRINSLLMTAPTEKCRFGKPGDRDQRN